MLAVLAAADAFISTVDLCERMVGAPTRSTLNTILNRLLDKGMVQRVRVGRQYEYRLAVDEADVVAGRMHEHLRLASDQQYVLSRFVETLSGEQARILRVVLNDLPVGVGEQPSVGDGLPGDGLPGVGPPGVGLLGVGDGLPIVGEQPSEGAR